MRDFVAEFYSCKFLFLFPWQFIWPFYAYKNLNETFLQPLRCQLQEKEVDCFEKDVDMEDLKEQVFYLSGLVRQLHIQKAELSHRGKSQVHAFGCGVILFVYLGIGSCILTEL